MRQRMWRRVVAAVAGALVLAGSAAAQQPAAAGPGGLFIPQAAPAAPVVVPGSGGCTNCGSGGGTAHRGFVMSGGGGYLTSNCPLGATCNNGCGSAASTAKFVLGPCSSFFAPCGPGYYGRGKCPGTPVYGVGPRVGMNPCVYDSYLNH